MGVEIEGLEFQVETKVGKGVEWTAYRQTGKPW